MALEEAIEELGGVPKMVRTGHTFMKKELREFPGSPMAGEMSGHFFMNDHWDGFDDSIYCAARLLSIIGMDPSPEQGGPQNFLRGSTSCQNIPLLMKGRFLWLVKEKR
ncbi:MAG: hypothetical protein Ct9H90mP21_2390 [Methanobacteriota archaeon]|nr:MAG: hypothetical protein Ct9H90mP21_2390 [Euryarchaeota archaeon]